MSTRIRLTRLGARRTPDGVEPSCGVMDIQTGSQHYRIVTDCGLIPIRVQEPGQEPSWHVPDLSFFEDGKPIDAVRLTHVHGDHAGFTPALAKYLAPKARVWMTPPSEAMIPHVFEDGLKAFERAGVERPLFDAGDVADIHLRIRRIFKPGPFEVLPGITDYVHPEGHIGGACSFTTLVGGKRVHYSGDRCSHDQPGIRGAQLLPREWHPHVIANSDCTYGADPDSNRRTWREEMNRGLELCASTLRSGAPVLFCSFGVHRGGAVVHELSRHGIPNLAPVYLDGSCRTYTEIAMSDRGRWSELDTLLHVDGVRWIGCEKGARYEASQPRAYAVVSTPGMGGPGGAAAFWKRQVLPNPDALLVFTGYLAPDTDGARILEADAERRRTGVNPVLAFEDQDPEGRPRVERLPFRCKVLQIRIGAHDSQGKILEWFRGYRPETAVLCHGSEAALASLASSLEGDIPQVVRSDEQRTVEIEF